MKCRSYCPSVAVYLRCPGPGNERLGLRSVSRQKIMPTWVGFSYWKGERTSLWLLDLVLSYPAPSFTKESTYTYSMRSFWPLVRSGCIRGSHTSSPPRKSLQTPDITGFHSRHSVLWRDKVGEPPQRTWRRSVQVPKIPRSKSQGFNLEYVFRGI
ncbi:hypothetical protein SODALDRAFT_91269 [Sodiomyces alkalinus F11]|uniref:Uncharacterized protein n=1 Tax=Sodiomyces alkalinus (strain CBS 110278 / VKM F-3762 / F11) TaxID=1314773 RepID=A0A3N2Q0F8_SODAK|nr:hypothetical protein SODALDRAFT_91269 [Sodiomyces alkalinus F11]ROT40222.1 hypothetical protein SODALDRAFT_91269 [Sodiomyces alkalinus F11]